MEQLDYIIILLYFLGLIAVSVVMSRKIKNSEDMFIAGRNSSWWLSGVSSYMTIFSASTFVVWGGVAYKSGLVAVVVALCLGVASFIVGKWISGKWRELRIKSPGEFLTIRFGHRTVSFYTISGIIARALCGCCFGDPAFLQKLSNCCQIFFTSIRNLLNIGFIR